MSQLKELGEPDLSARIARLTCRLIQHYLDRGEIEAAKRRLDILSRHLFKSIARSPAECDCRCEPDYELWCEAEEHEEAASRFADAIHSGDGQQATEMANKLCRDLCGRSIFRPLHIGALPWERAA